MPVEEYEFDNLADDSEDEQKLWAAGRRVLSKLGGFKFHQGAARVSENSDALILQPFRLRQFRQQLGL